MQQFIYVLLCPDTGKVCYVGRTTNPRLRERSHYRGYHDTPVDMWKKALTANGKRPIFRIIETSDGNLSRTASWREHWWIRYFRRHGQPLRNVVTLTPKEAKRQTLAWAKYRSEGRAWALKSG